MSTYTIPSPKQSRAKETVAVVIEAARSVLTRSGESAVRIQEISATTGVSIGSIYHHFGDRDGLIRATYIHNFAEGVGNDIEKLKGWASKTKSAAEIREHYADLIEFLNNHYRQLPIAERAAIVGSSFGRPELRAAISEVQTSLTNGLTELMTTLKESGVLKDHLHPRAAALVILGLLHGRVLAEFDTENTSTDEDWNRAVLSAMSGLVKVAA